MVSLSPPIYNLCPESPNLIDLMIYFSETIQILKVIRTGLTLELKIILKNLLISSVKFKILPSLLST